MFSVGYIFLSIENVYWQIQIFDPYKQLFNIQTLTITLRMVNVVVRVAHHREPLCSIFLSCSNHLTEQLINKLLLMRRGMLWLLHNEHDLLMQFTQISKHLFKHIINRRYFAHQMLFGSSKRSYLYSCVFCVRSLSQAT